jgi:hypothetical protein
VARPEFGVVQRAWVELALLKSDRSNAISRRTLLALWSCLQGSYLNRLDSTVGVLRHGPAAPGKATRIGRLLAVVLVRVAQHWEPFFLFPTPTAIVHPFIRLWTRNVGGCGSSA